MAEPSSSIVLELQRLASDGSTSISELLRKAFQVATKLKVADFKAWIHDEEAGYAGKKFPEYRIIPAELKSYNPFHGWQGIAINHAELARVLSARGLGNPIAELEARAKLGGGDTLVALPAETLDCLRHMMSPLDSGYEIKQQISISSIAGIVEKVRFTILEWSLKLEQEGILGEGMTFSDAEKEKAATSTTIHVEHNSGNIGNVTAQNVQFGNYSAIHEQLKAAGVTQEERNELENITDGLKDAKGEEKKTLLARGVGWLQRNGKSIGILATVVEGWLEGHGHKPSSP